MRAVDALAGQPRPVAGAVAATSSLPPPRRLMIVLEPVSHPELAPIRIHDTLFAIGRTEAPFDGYPPGLAADLSRRHARIFCEQGAVYLAELGSKNGSSVNGATIRQAIATLHEGDLLGLGKTLVYRVHLEQAALQPQHARLASLTLAPEHPGSGLQPIVVTEFPFLVSKADATFARYKDSDPAQVNYLSRRHAHLFLRGGQLHVEDLGSTNGTFVNGTRLEEHAPALQEDDLLAFGGRHFVYRVGMQWEEPPRDPTLTRIGVLAASGPASGTAEPAAELAPDADRTTFVATADSFLDIFCVEPPPAADALPDAAPSETAAAAPPRSGIAAVRAVLAGKAQGRRRVIAGLALALLLALLLGWLLVRIGSPEREVEDLLAEHAYARAAGVAAGALADDPGNRRLVALGTEAVLKARLPGWMALLRAGQYGRAAAEVGAMRRQAGNNPELTLLLDELDWIVALQSFVAARGGGQVPVRNAQDAARIARFLRQWDEQGEAHQRAFVTMSAHVPAYRDTYADALSEIRRLALAGSAP